MYYLHSSTAVRQRGKKEEDKIRNHLMRKIMVWIKKIASTPPPIHIPASVLLMLTFLRRRQVSVDPCHCRHRRLRRGGP